MSNRKRPVKAYLLCLGFVLLAGIFEARTQPVGIEKGYLVSADRQGGTTALAQAAGEFRIVEANLLWDNVVDPYHHRWMQKYGDWSKNVSILPLLKLIIDLDPHFTDAYGVMCGEILPRTGKIGEAHRLLDKGIHDNPYAGELYREQAILYAWQEHRNDLALPYAEAGLKNVSLYVRDNPQAEDIDDAQFEQRLLEELTKTLRDRVAHEPVSAGRQPAPVPAAAAAQSPPSGSN